MDPLALPEAVKQTRLSPPQIIAAISRSDAERAGKHGRILDACMIGTRKCIFAGTAVFTGRLAHAGAHLLEWRRKGKRVQSGFPLNGSLLAGGTVKLSR